MHTASVLRCLVEDIQAGSWLLKMARMVRDASEDLHTTDPQAPFGRHLTSAVIKTAVKSDLTAVAVSFGSTMESIYHKSNR